VDTDPYTLLETRKQVSFMTIDIEVAIKAI